MDTKKALKKYFGLDSFRDKQEETINSLLAGKNTLTLMPTGMGKSLIFQMTALLQDKTALVISPLLALMDQQTKGLNNSLSHLNKSAYSFNSNAGTVKKQFEFLRDEFNPPNNPQFIYVSPEKMMIDGYAELVFREHRKDIGLIVIDEAHCVSQWGHSFRPTYKLIPSFLKSIFGDNIPPVLCLTATVNQRDKAEIIHDFNVENVIQSDVLLRTNIQLNIEEEFKNNDEKKVRLEELLNEYRGQKVIVYVHIKGRDYGTRALSQYFKDLGFHCAPFDADLSKTQKDEILEGFTSGKLNVIFATNAFGMGIDIPDIRCVIHYLIPESIEQYYQEVGRSGRDGNPAFAYLLHTEPNARIRKDLIKKGKVAKESIEDFWDTLTGRKKEIPYIGQLGMTDVSDDNSEMILFLKLLNKGFVSIEAKGIQNTRCFKEKGDCPEFVKLDSISKNGLMKLISKKSSIDLYTLHEKVFGYYYNGKLDIDKTPQKLLYYRIIKELDEKDIEEMVKEFDQLVKFKLENLEKLLDVLSGNIDITSALEKHLGILKV